MKKRDNILKQADICDAREALHKSPKLEVMYFTPGEFKSVYAAFKKMENEIKELRRELQWERLDNKYLSDWQICKEPKPKPLLADAKVGDLCKTDLDEWIQIDDTSEPPSPILYHFDRPFKGNIIHTEPLAPEGSAEWALQMWKLGNDIRNETGVVLMADYESEEIRVKHLVDVFPSGWQLYKEPKPEPAKEQFNANQEIDNLKAQIAKLQADNRSFVEQIRRFKMIEKVECPYCGKDINVDTDNWYDEDEAYEHQCEECGKYCMVRASVSWSYDAEKLNCKNGLAEHK